jgi:RNA polymerase sigma-70 factor (ECF subfamily)
MASTEELVCAVRNGDRSAFGELVRLYERAAILSAHSVLRDYGKSQDAAQEGFMIAYTKLNQLTSPAAFGPWLLKIVQRRAVLMQKQRRMQALQSDIQAAILDRSPEWIYRYEDVIEQIAKLPIHERIVVVLRYVNQYPVQRIAEITGRPFETVKKQLSRALQRLRKTFQQVQS